MTTMIEMRDRPPGEPPLMSDQPQTSPDSLTLEYVERIDSTNQTLLDSAFGEAPRAPRVLCAHEQIAGRGRRGRNWLAEPGRSLCFSVAIESGPVRVDPSLGLAVGVAVAQTLATLTDSIALKWPNDLLRRNAKCGGILIERRRSPRTEKLIERVVIGVGLNLLRPEDAQGLIDPPAAGVFDRPDGVPDRTLMLGKLAEAIVATEHRHRLEGFALWVDAWREFDAWIGRPVQVSDAGRLLAWGVHRGVAPDGSLLLESNGSERRIVAGDVSLRENGAPDPRSRRGPLMNDRMIPTLTTGRGREPVEAGKQPSAGLGVTLFTYGSLMFEPVWRRLVAHPCASMRAELPGFRRERVVDETYPGIVRDAAAQTMGRVYFGVNADDLRRLDHFEGAAYQRTRVTVRFAAPSGAAVSIEVEAYVFQDETALSGEPWVPEAFEREWAEGFFERHAAQADAGAVKPPG